MALTHFNEEGRARMVDVSAKPKTMRVARAAGKVRMSQDTLELVRTGGVTKGDVLAVAQVAGIMAAKRTWETVPMCHPVQLTGVDVSFSYAPDGIDIEATTRCCGETGVEMEALCAVSAAGLAIYDMCKSHQRDMMIGKVRLVEKDGGKSGHFVRDGRDTATSEDAVLLAPQKGVEGVVSAVCVSERKGERKIPAGQIELVVGLGVAGDAHAGNWHRQVSLLADEAVDTMREALPELSAGDFAENILTRGVCLRELPVGTMLEVGPCLLAVTQIGKQCHNDCAIKQKTGRCVMPTQGVFAVVVRGGIVRAGDTIRIMEVGR